MNVSVLDKLSHESEEERQNKRSNVTTIDIGITHDNHFVITKFFEIQSLAVFFGSDSHPKCRKNIANLFVFKHFVVHGFFHIQNLTTQRHNCLKGSITSLFCCSTRRVSLN